MNINRLILASSSQWRGKLLNEAGIDHLVRASHVDESKIVPAVPRERAIERAIAKARAVARQESEAIVIGADQVLEFRGMALDKVRSREEARERLMSFSAERHELLSAFCLVASPDLGLAKDLLHATIVATTMRVRPLLPIEVDRYLDMNEWQDSVGCYRFEGLGVHLFEAIDGDTSAIIGLPLVPLVRELRRLGINNLLNPQGTWTLPSKP